MQSMANALDFDLFQITKSTKFSSHYPEAYGTNDLLCPTDPNLVSSSHRFERVLFQLTNKVRPGQLLKEIFISRAQELQQKNQHSGICLIGNKGVFLNSQGEFYPCCWTANRYEHNQAWHTKAQSQFNLNTRTFQDIITDDFWNKEFLEFDSLECQTKCTPDRLTDRQHTTEW
jgi:hypothetical protein